MHKQLGPYHLRPFFCTTGLYHFFSKKILTWTGRGRKILPVNNPYYLDNIHDILVTNLYTAMIKDAVPVSIVLVADSGTGKSKLLQSLQGESIHQTDSFTSTGLFDIMQRDNKNDLFWIVTPDMNPTLSRRPGTVTSTVANLLTLTMDGTCRVDDGRSEKLCRHTPIGFLSGLTPDVYSKQAKKWLSLGLRRRIIPLFYTYTPETEDKLKKLQREDKISASPFPITSFSIALKGKPAIDKERALEIQLQGQQLANNLGLEKYYNKGVELWNLRHIVPISPIETLRTLARANAIRQKRGEVSEVDIEFLSKFVGFTNPSAPKQL